ncbi:hypothetical protein SAMN04487967_2444 [Natronorubrum sediminis]|uniref:Uncharacterized protein n=1 Tax=Natronorubrum sediminis TaxID=640943 RepID=A0A1H6G0L1_9EURY|nr:hypothetical protein [Natronorubrum sediminis]SEH16120.1 hypothetical protein SAMN04487967_2444 [Natronorubrum sediminis]
MHRRRVLVSGVSVATLSLAGCLSDSSGDDSGGSADDDDSAASTDEEPADLIESADETLDEAAAEFEAVLDDADDPLDDSSWTIETAGIEARIDDAEDDLSTAREAADGDETDVIDALEGVADFLREFVDLFVDLGEAMNELDAWEQYLDQERWDDAETAAGRAAAHNDDARDHATVARSTFEEIDTSVLEEVDEVDAAEMEAELEEIEDVLELLDVYFSASELMAEAMQPFENGVESLEVEEFQSASSSFESAAETFDDAYSVVTDAEDDAPAEFRSDLIDLACEVNALAESAEYYALGSEEYADGDWVAGDSYFEDGERALEQCENNEVVPSL